MSETNEYTWAIDGKTKAEALPPGPWQDEPDKLVWIDADTDLDCMIVRGRAGALCGYVGVPPEHPSHGNNYWHDEGGPSVDVHGGLTYADLCSDIVCHVPEHGRPGDVWWFGFDCAHAYDFIPALTKYRLPTELPDDVYKDIAYVKAEVTSLAKQLAAIHNHGIKGP